MEPRLLRHYKTYARPHLAEQFQWSNPNQIPKIEKVVMNVGVGEATKNAKLLAAVVGELGVITGQKALVTRIVDSAGSEGEVMSFSASEVYVLAERQSANRFLRLDNSFSPFAYLIDPRGCEGVLEEILERQPTVIVVRAGGYQGRCVQRIEKRLLKSGYGATIVMFPLPERGGVVPGTTPVQQAWRVYGHTDTGWSLSTHPGRAP